MAKVNKLEQLFEMDRERNVRTMSGNVYLYVNEGYGPWTAYNYASELNIPTKTRYLDEVGHHTALKELLAVVNTGDTIVLGSITDLISPTVCDMLLILEAMEARGVIIKAKLQPQYSLTKYQEAIRLMIELTDDWEFSKKTS